MNFMQALIFFVPQFYKLFRNYHSPGVLPTEHNPYFETLQALADYQFMIASSPVTAAAPFLGLAVLYRISIVSRRNPSNTRRISG